ncbi:MAG: hypothetical protein DMF88_20460, partial [Acidobacteria bacterium]
MREGVCSLSSTGSSAASSRRVRTRSGSAPTARTHRCAGRITSVTSNPRLPFDVDEAADKDKQARERAVDPRYNVTLEASAGTGKTRVLVDRYINLLRAGVDPSNILAMTFTRKAATEMRERIIATLRAAAQRGEIAPARWRELRDRIDEIAISTIDAFCLSLLREFPLEADLDPGFDVADETEVPRLIDESLDRALRTCRILAREDENIALVFAQLGDRRAPGDRAASSRRGIGNAGCRHGAARRVRRDARRHGAVSRVGSTRACLPAAREESPESRTERGARSRGDPGGLRARTRLFPDAGRRAAQEVPVQPGSVRQQGRLVHASRSRGRPRAVGEGGHRALQTGPERPRVARHPADVPHCRDRIPAHARCARRARLRGPAAARARSAAPHGGVRAKPLSPGVALPPRARRRVPGHQPCAVGARIAPGPSPIFIVGDRKQSIYAFRDADASILDDARRHIEALRPQGDARRAISRSFRSVPALLSFINDVARDVQKSDSRRDAFRYGEDDRFPVDGVEPNEALGLATGDTPDACAETTAAEIARLLEAGAIVRDKTTGLRRPMTAADVAILFRTRESHREYEDALEARGIAVYVYKGLGFFDADEIKDVTALLWYLAEPQSDLRTAAFLRSRF